MGFIDLHGESDKTFPFGGPGGWDFDFDFDTGKCPPVLFASPWFLDEAIVALFLKTDHSRDTSNQISVFICCNGPNFFALVYFFTISMVQLVKDCKEA